MRRVLIYTAMFTIRAAAHFAPEHDRAALRAHLPLLRHFLSEPDRRREEMIHG